MSLSLFNQYGIFSSSGVISPPATLADIYAANGVQRFDGQAQSFTNGQSITSMPVQGNTNAVLTGSTAPVWNSTGINGHPALSTMFNQILESPAHPAIVGTPWTFAVVYQRSSQTNSYYVIRHLHNGGGTPNDESASLFGNPVDGADTISFTKGIYTSSIPIQDTTLPTSPSRVLIASLDPVTGIRIATMALDGTREYIDLSSGLDYLGSYGVGTAMYFTQPPVTQFGNNGFSDDGSTNLIGEYFFINIEKSYTQMEEMCNLFADKWE